MYWKVLKDNKVIDVLDHLSFVKYQEKHDIMIACSQSEAQAIASSDGRYAWHISGLRDIPIDKYDTVDLVIINKYEYDKLKLLNLQTPEEIIDAYTMSLIKEGLL
jgi:hypothetical protein